LFAVFKTDEYPSELNKLDVRQSITAKSLRCGKIRKNKLESIPQPILEIEKEVSWLKR
jgi:hypothetical protein